MLVDCVAERLKDGRWHYVHDIARELDQPEERILKIIQFFAEFKMVVFNELGSRVRIDERFAKLFD